MRLKSTEILCSAVVYVSLSQATGLDPIKNFCSRWYHQSQVKNDVLYIDGGIASFSERAPYSNPAAHDDRLNYTGPVVLGPNNYFIVVDMRTSWDWKTNVSEQVINKTVALGTSNYVPRVQSGALFHGGSGAPDDPQIYLYGGVTPDVNTSFENFQAPTTNQYTLWGFNTESYQWTQYDVMLNVPERPSWGAYAEAPEHSLAFYLNGLVTNMSSAVTEQANMTTTNLGGMVVLDLQNHTATNRSTDTVADSPRVRGAMVFISQIGGMGILVSLGGATGIGESLRPVSMSQATIFDVAVTTDAESGSDSGWYTQTIPGTAPPPRVDFCAIVVSAPDNSSFNIYIYGGWDPTSDEYFDDIWVLSIPSFTWIQVYKGVLPRYGHTCHVVGNRQMVTVGGINSTDTTTCDWEWMGVAILDLTAMAWGSVYDSAKPAYQVSPLISAAIGGGLDGGATKLLPDAGWTSIAVANLFTGTSSQTAPFVPPSNDDTPGSNGGGSGGTHTGAIVGGSVGGGVGLLGVVAGLVFWRRWRRKREVGREGTGRAGRAELAGPGEPKPDDSPSGSPPGVLAHITPHTPLSELGGSPVISELPENQIAIELADNGNIYDRNSWRPGESEELTVHAINAR